MMVDPMIGAKGLYSSNEQKCDSTITPSNNLFPARSLVVFENPNDMGLISINKLALSPKNSSEAVSGVIMCRSYWVEVTPFSDIISEGSSS